MRKMTYILLILLCLVLALPALIRPQGAPPAGGTWLGDVDEDGKINIFDLLGVLKILSTGEYTSERQQRLANLDKSENGAVNIFDLLAMLRLLSGASAPEAVFWGPPSLATVNPAHVIPGETVELTIQNMYGSIPLRLYLGSTEREILSVVNGRATFTVPDSFPGGDLSLVSGDDTLGSRFLNIRNTNVHTIGGCPLFPADNPWNQPVDAFPVHKDSDLYLDKMNKTAGLHPDMGPNEIYGIPYDVVGGDQPHVPTRMASYPDESDPGPYPIPDNPRIEGTEASTGDRHVLVVDSTNCMLYEVGSIYREGEGWRVVCGAIFNLNSNAQRPDGWTSADAAGLPILTGIVQYEEVAAGEVNHAIRFTMRNSQRAYVYPASHYASTKTDPYLPPMGLRVRLKADYNISGLTGQALVIARALKKYGMIMADNGGDWFFTGGRSPNWNDTQLNSLKSIGGANFEVVDTERMVISGKGERYNIRPGVEINLPAQNAVFAAGDSILIRVNAWDNDDHGVALVEFFDGSQKVGQVSTAPWEFTLQGASGGQHIISARATDSAGASNTSWGVRVTVQ